MRQGIRFISTVFFSFFAITFAQALSTGPISNPQLAAADLRCYSGHTNVEYPNVTPLEEGAECMTTPLANTDTQYANECKGDTNPSVKSVCKKGWCTAISVCGKPLSDTPIELPPPPSPTPTTPAPTPTTPIPAPVQLPAPTPTGSGGSGSGSDGGSGSVPTNTLPPVTVIQDPGATPKPGTSLIPQGPPYTLTPGAKPPSGSPGSGGVLEGENPFPGDTNTTFPGSGWTGSGGANMTSFLGFFSDVISTFLPLFSGSSGSGIFSSGSNGGQAPTPQVRPQPQQIAQQSPQDILRDFNLRFPPPNPLDTELPRNASGFPVAPVQQPDRIGDVPAMLEGLLGSPLTGGGAQPTTDNCPNNCGNPAPLPGQYFDITPRQPVPPRVPRPLQPGDIIRADAGNSITDESPPLPIDIPEWWSDRMRRDVAAGIETGFSNSAAYNQARANEVARVFAALEDGDLPLGDPAVETARRILEQDISIAKQTRDRAYLTSSLPFQEWVDKTFGGVLSSSYKRAVDAAEDRLARLGDLEGKARIAALAGPLEAPSTPARPSIVTVTNEPISDAGFRSIPTPVDVARAVYAWWTGPTETATTPSIEVPAPIPSITPTTPPTQPVPIPTTPPVTPPVPAPMPTPPLLEPEPSRLLDGLSAAAKKVYEGVNAAARKVGFGGGTDLPAPVSSAQPPASSSGISSGMLRTGMSLLSALMQSLSSLFSNDSNSSSSNPNQTPPVPTPSAALVANPPVIDAGERTRLSWTSVGALSCVVVDTELRIIAGDAMSGDVQSPVLEKSTRFGVICDIAGGKDKFVNETLVRVRDDASDPKALFAQQGRISQSAAVNRPAVNAMTTQDLDEQTPLDVRTCEPNQPMESFIRCLCAAEPNPNGCTFLK